MGEMSSSADEVAAFEATSFSSDWTFKQTDDLTESTWLPVKNVPSTVHQDLIDNKR